MPNYDDYRRLCAEEKLLIEEARAINRRHRWSNLFLMVVIVGFSAVSFTVAMQEHSELNDFIGDVSLMTYLLLVVGRFAYQYHLRQRGQAIRLWAAELQLRFEEFHYQARGSFYGE